MSDDVAGVFGIVLTLFYCCRTKMSSASSTTTSQKVFENVMVFRAAVLFDETTGERLALPMDSTRYSIAVDRGLLSFDAETFCIRVSAICGERNVPTSIELVFNLCNVQNIECTKVISPNLKVAKGKTVLRMTAKVDTTRPLEDYAIKMDVKDHDLLHREIMRVTHRQYATNNNGCLQRNN